MNRKRFIDWGVHSSGNVFTHLGRWIAEVFWQLTSIAEWDVTDLERDSLPIMNINRRNASLGLGLISPFHKEGVLAA